MKKTHIIAIIVIASCIGILISVTGNTSSYVNFTQAATNPEIEYHVVGEWVKDSEIEYEPSVDPNYFAFQMKDEQGQIRKVVYRNNKPQDFEKSEKVVVVGKMSGDEFEASTILMKCPSKYNEEWVDAKNTTSVE